MHPLKYLGFLALLLESCISDKEPIQLYNVDTFYISSARKVQIATRFNTSYKEVYYISSSQAASDTVAILKYDCNKDTPMRFHIGDCLKLNFKR